MSSSVIPSAKYSWVGSFERFSNGRTATERICGPGDAAVRRSRQCPGFQSRAAATAMTAAAPSRASLPAKVRVREAGPAGGSRMPQGVREVELLNRSDEAVAAPGERFDEAGVLGGVAQSVTDAIDGAIEAAVEVHDRVVRPDPLLQLFPRPDLARPPPGRSRSATSSWNGCS